MIRRLLLSVGCLVAIASCASSAEDQYFDSNGVKIRYIVEGKGEPVVLIHGFTADADKNWRGMGVPPGGANNGNSVSIFDRLAKDYQVIAIDNRGHGKSGKPHDPKQYGAEMAEDVVRLLDHLKIAKAHVIGYSMGGMITARLVSAHPDRLLSAVLGGHGGVREGEPSEFYETLAKSLDEGKGFGPLFERLTPEGSPKPPPAQIAMANAMLMQSNDVKALAAACRGFPGLAFDAAKFEANQVPTLAIVGERDPLKKGVEALKGHMGNLKIVIVKGTDHMTTIPSPDFINNITEFLEQHSSKPKLKKAG
jgi:pimeloyl-ACP methyl ester carboxylesterase